MSDLQKEYTDKLIKATILPFIPYWIKPNHVSWLRILSVPFVMYLLWNEMYLIGIVVFSLSALTDAIDGAQARTRNQVTELGKILDPIGDRGLIGGAAIILIPRFYGWPLFIILALLEIFQSIKAHFIKEKVKKNLDANWAGKFKMIFQSLSLGILMLGVLIESMGTIDAGRYLMYLAIVFLIFQPFVYKEERQYKKEKRMLR